MMPDLHGVLQRLVHEKGRIPAGDVDVRFDPPKREWVASLVRPTIDFFLFDVRENTELRSSSLQSTRTGNGATYRVPPRRFDLRYMVSVLTTVVEDEHLLLWRVLATLMRHADLPTDILPPALATLEPSIVTQVARADEPSTFLDVWSALEVPPRPALLYVVTAPLDLDIAFQSPLVLTRTTRMTRGVRRGGEPSSEPSREPLAAGSSAIGGVVRTRDGRPLAGARVSVAGRALASVETDADGRFLLGGLDEGPVTLEARAGGGRPTRAAFQIPSDSYEIVID
jgi:hypothetical protein